MSQNYISSNGLVLESLPEIITQLENDFKEIYGSDINLNQNSSDAQLLNIFAQAKKDILDLIRQYYNNIDVDSVIGIPQQILYKLNNCYIRNYTYSFTMVNVTVNQPLVLQGLDGYEEDVEDAEEAIFTVSDSQGNRWHLVNTAPLTSGTHLLNFRAAEVGSINALSNTIQIIETVQRGVVSVNNPANSYIIGATGETSAEFRQRRNRCVQAASQGFAEGLEGALLALDNVTQVKVYDNSKEFVVSDMPPHSVWVIIVGGDSQEIGRTIYNNIVPGIPLKGSNVVSITKVNGDISNVYYDTGAPITLYVKATIYNFTTDVIDEDFIKRTLAGNNFEIKQMVETATLTTQMKEALGDQGTVYNVEISSDSSTWAEFLTPNGLNEYFVITNDSITLNIEQA